MMTFGTLMVAFGLGRLIGRHDSQVFDDLVFAAMPRVMEVTTGIQNARR